MLEQRRLDGRIYKAIAPRMMPAEEEPSRVVDEEMLVAAGLAAFNDIYGENVGGGS